LAKLKSYAIFSVNGTGIDRDSAELEGGGHSFGEIQDLHQLLNTSSGDGSYYGYSFSDLIKHNLPLFPATL
jgi:hypothetical protein